VIVLNHPPASRSTVFHPPAAESSTTSTSESSSRFTSSMYSRPRLARASSPAAGSLTTRTQIGL